MSGAAARPKTSVAARTSTHAGALLRDAVPDPILGDHRPGSHDLGRRRIDLRDLEKTIGLGIVRPGDKRSAHFGAVPAGCDAEPKRLLYLNVTRRKVLHGGYAFMVAVRSYIDRREIMVVARRSRPWLFYAAM